MSLINEALKKAQSRRTNDPTATPPALGTGSGEPTAKRGKPWSTATIVLIAGGAVSLVAISAVVTVYLYNAREAPKAANLSTAVAAAAHSKLRGEPAITAPVMAPAIPVASVDRTSPPPLKTSAPVTLTISVAAPAIPTLEANPNRSSVPPPTTPMVTEVIVPPSPAAAVAASKSDERIHAFLDGMRITGVRTSGNESRVLVNGSVYRVNEIVDRALGLKLIKVEANKLTFADANGELYVKTF